MRWTIAVPLIAVLEGCASSPHGSQEAREPKPVEESPRLLVQVPPEYPPDVRAQGIEGRVTFQMIIDTAGVPELDSFRIVSSPSTYLSEAVKVAVAAWRYTPARVNGRAVRVRIEQRIDFHRNRPRVVGP
jgi:TonB family protein